MTHNHTTTAERAEARAKLRELIKPGSTVYTILRHRSKSGMSRRISCAVVDTRGGAIDDISFWVARACGYSRDKTDHSLRVQGCGMDMGFSVVYNLGRALWPDGFPCNGKRSSPDRCLSNAHNNGARYRTGDKHNDGGYALNHKWL